MVNVGKGRAVPAGTLSLGLTVELKTHLHHCPARRYERKGTSLILVKLVPFPFTPMLMPSILTVIMAPDATTCPLSFRWDVWPHRHLLHQNSRQH